MGSINNIIIRIIKRIIEMLSKKYFLNLVSKSYKEQYGSKHNTVIRVAQRWFGIEQVGPIKIFFSRWFMDFVFQAQIDIFRTKKEKHTLGVSNIGFSDLSIYCTSHDANSSIVYLIGFCDNMTYFDLYKSFAKPGSTVFDVGANIGMHTLVLSKCVGSNGHVFSFEPVDEIYRRLKQNIELNGITNINAKKLGIGDHPGVVKFDENLGDFNIGKGRVNERGSATIEITTIDEQAKECDSSISIIKIDIEEYELKAIQGGQETLKKHEPVIVCEFNPHTYTFLEFKKHIPFNACYYRIPLSYYEKLKPIENSFSGHEELLIVPASKSQPEV